MKTMAVLFSLVLATVAGAADFNMGLSRSIKTGDAILLISTVHNGVRTDLDLYGTASFKFGQHRQDPNGNTSNTVELVALDVTNGPLTITEQFGGSDEFDPDDAPCEMSGNGCSRGDMVFQPDAGGRYSVNVDSYVYAEGTGVPLFENTEPIEVLGTIEGNTISFAWTKVPVDIFGGVATLEAVSLYVTIAEHIDTGLTEAQDLITALLPEHEAFCAAQPVTTSRERRACRRLDWNNDEPLMRIPSESDCIDKKLAQGVYVCVAK